MAVRWACMLVIVAAGVAAPAWAEDAELIYCRKSSFRIPFQIDPNEVSRTKEIQLYVSEGRGRPWKPYKTASPDQHSFAFEADRDGFYYFLVRTISTDGRAYPPTVEQAAPGLRVCVDTAPPQVSLRALPPRGDNVGFEWEIRDDHPDLSTLQVEYRSRSSQDWQRLNVELLARGQRYFPPSVRGPCEVRLRVSDKAENQAVRTLLVGGSATAGVDQPRDEGFGQGPRGNAGDSSRLPRLVNSADLALSYAIEEVGPSGVSVVELYVTRDGRSWRKQGEDEDRQSPFNVTLPGEGTYGLTLVVKSGVGKGDRPPQPGDQPQIWVEVDLTKPVVAIAAVDAAKGNDGNLLTILWKAEDKNLAPQPISLLYGETADGPWQPIVTSIENSGRYVWRIPPASPYKFFVRVEAVDRAGNVGRADTPQQVVVDLAQPKGRLLGVENPSR